MPDISDILDSILTGASPAYRAAGQAPYELEEARQRAKRAGLQNQSIQSALDDLTRERTERAAAPAAAQRVMSGYAAQPASIDRSGVMDTNDNPEAAGTPAPMTPGRPAARTLPDLMSRGVSAEDYDLASKYRPESVKGLGLLTPEAAQQKELEARTRTRTEGAQNEALAAIDQDTTLTSALKAVARSAISNGASAKDVIALFQKPQGQSRYLSTPRGVFDTQEGTYAGGPDDTAPQPESMEISGERWIKKPNAQGLPTWQRESNPVLDWIEAHPKQVAGLSPAQARDLAASELEKRKATTRIDITQPTAGADAIDRAADYFNSTGQMPAGLGFGNARLRAQIMDRAAQKAKEMGGDLGLAATQANFKANQAELNRLQTQRGPVLAFAATAHKNLDLAEQLSASVDRTQIPVINKWLLSGQQQWAGDPSVAAFAAATRTAINEFAKVTSSASGGGVTSDAARREIEAILSTAQSPEQFRRVAQTLRQEMQNRVGGYDEQIAATQARISKLGGGAPQPPAAPAAPGAVPGGAEQPVVWKVRSRATGRERQYQPGPGETQPPAGYDRVQ